VGGVYMLGIGQCRMGYDDCHYTTGGIVSVSLWN
jgi:hypothetical protein